MCLPDQISRCARDRGGGAPLALGTPAVQIIVIAIIMIIMMIIIIMIIIMIVVVIVNSTRNDITTIMIKDI